MAGKKKKSNAKVLLFCTALALTAGCNKQSDSTAPVKAVTLTPPKAPITSKSGVTAAEQTAGMVQAAPQGKSQVPVELKFDIAQRPKVGQPVDINLALIAQIDASPATILVSGADDVSVPGAKQFDIPSAEAGEVYRETVSVTPNAEGVLLLGVTVSLKHDEMLDQRVFSIPIVADR